MKKIKNRFGILLAELEHRENRRYSYRTVAEETGLSTSAVMRWANNRVKRFDESILVTLCTFFSCSIGDLLELIDD